MLCVPNESNEVQSALHICWFHIHRFRQQFDLWFLESTGVEFVDVEGQLYYAILYMGLEHPCIWYLRGVLESVPHGYHGTSVQYIDQEFDLWCQKYVSSSDFASNYTTLSK